MFYILIFRRSIIPLVLLAVLQAGCALSPQQVTIKPDISVSAASYGGQHEIVVQVVDQRPGTIIGTRGGVYGDSSTIEVGNDHKMEIAYAVVNGLNRWGFKAQVKMTGAQATQFTLSLDQLTYKPESNSAVGKIAMTAAVSVTIQRGNSHYRGSYAASNEMGFVMLPSESDNSEQINKVLSMALQKIFEDQGLIQFLQQ
jgi:uncharacterized lipoprotein